MDSGHYVYDLLDYNTGIWWIFDDDMITNYSGYLENIYDDFSHENEQNKGEIIIMNVSDRIVSMLYIKRDILISRTYSFCTGESVSKYIKNIKDRIAEFEEIKEEFW